MGSDAVPSSPTSDLNSPEEIGEMVRRFYADVAQDHILGPMFNDVAKVDWSLHIPMLVSFWSRVILGERGYSGNPLRKHAAVHAKQPFTEAHFRRWLELFNETIDLGWRGPNAERAKRLAHNVANVHAKQLLAPIVGPADQIGHANHVEIASIEQS